MSIRSVRHYLCLRSRGKFKLWTHGRHGYFLWGKCLAALRRGRLMKTNAKTAYAKWCLMKPWKIFRISWRKRTWRKSWWMKLQTAQTCQHMMASYISLTNCYPMIKIFPSLSVAASPSNPSARTEETPSMISCLRSSLNQSSWIWS